MMDVVVRICCAGRVGCTGLLTREKKETCPTGDRPGFVCMVRSCARSGVGRKEGRKVLLLLLFLLLLLLLLLLLRSLLRSLLLLLRSLLLRFVVGAVGAVVVVVVVVAFGCSIPSP